MEKRSRSARMTSARTSRLLSHPERNSQAVDQLRRRIQMLTSPGLAGAFAKTAELTIHSCYHSLEGGQRFSVDMLIAVLIHLPLREIEAALNEALSRTRFRVVLLPAGSDSLPAPLLAATAPVPVRPSATSRGLLSQGQKESSRSACIVTAAFRTPPERCGSRPGRKRIPSSSG